MRPCPSTHDFMISMLLFGFICIRFKSVFHASSNLFPFFHSHMYISFFFVHTLFFLIICWGYFGYRVIAS